MPSAASAASDESRTIGASSPTIGEHESRARLVEGPDEKWEKWKLEAVHLQKEGYPQLAMFLNSDPNFRVARKHGYIRMRLLLYFQYLLQKHREELDRMDERDEGGNEYDKFKLFSQSSEEEQEQSPRIKLYRRIEADLKRYDELLLREHLINGMHKPSDRNFRSVYNFVFDEKPMEDSEMEVYYYKDDFVSLANGKEFTWLEAKMEEMLAYAPKFVVKLFTTADDEKRTIAKTVIYHSPQRIHMAAKGVMMLVATVGILLPMMLLFAFSASKAAKIATVLAFGLTFPAAIAMCTTIEPHHVFMMSAAYFAVMVVFLSNSDDTCCSNVRS